MLSLPLACQGSYPLAPTACDDWCEATKELQCGFYSPAGCVAECEQSGRASRPECRQQFDAALACYQNSEIPCDEDDPFYFFPGPYPCETEAQNLDSCIYTCVGCQSGGSVQCGRYCAAADATRCGRIDVQACRSFCDGSGLPAKYECGATFEALIQCLEQTSVSCDPTLPKACAAQEDALSACHGVCVTCL